MTPYGVAYPAEDHGIMPNVEIWHGSIQQSQPSQGSPASSARSSSSDGDCPEGTVLNAEGVCEVGSSWPIGSRGMFVLTALGLFAFMHFYGLQPIPRAKYMVQDMLKSYKNSYKSKKEKV